MLRFFHAKGPPFLAGLYPNERLRRRGYFFLTALRVVDRFAAILARAGLAAGFAFDFVAVRIVALLEIDRSKAARSQGESYSLDAVQL